MRKNFIKVKENFICDHCGIQVIGTGYTNHCPNCLYSKHVDAKIPGDRASSCQELMEPIGINIKSGQTVITHRCLKCGQITHNKISENDNQEEIIGLSQIPLKTK